MAGYAARVAVEPSGSERDTMERMRMRDIEGKTAREAASELGNERVSNGREHMSQMQFAVTVH
jgi:hypothetical protein